jgi:hypothetical protein
MRAQGASAEEILEGYPTLDKEKLAMAPLRAQAFPVRKSANRNPWSGKNPKLKVFSMRSWRESARRA